MGRTCWSLHRRSNQAPAGWFRKSVIWEDCCWASFSTCSWPNYDNHQQMAMKLLSIATFTGCSWLLVFPNPSWPWLLEPHVHSSRCISKKKRVEVQLACKRSLNLTSYNGPWVSPTSNSFQHLLQRLRNFNLSSARVPSVAPPTKYDLVQQPWLEPESEQRSLKQLLWEQHAIFHKQIFVQNFAEKHPRDLKRAFKMVSTISRMERTQQIQNSCKIYLFWKIKTTQCFL